MEVEVGAGGEDVDMLITLPYLKVCFTDLVVSCVASADDHQCQ